MKILKLSILLFGFSILGCETRSDTGAEVEIEDVTTTEVEETVDLSDQPAPADATKADDTDESTATATEQPKSADDTAATDTDGDPQEETPDND